MHLIKHTAEVIISVKNPKSKPNKTAPIKLVAANEIPKRIIDVIMVPNTPTKYTGKVRHKHLFVVEQHTKFDERKLIAR